jgi:hypothetical protein
VHHMCLCSKNKKTKAVYSKKLFRHMVWISFRMPGGTDGKGNGSLCALYIYIYSWRISRVSQTLYWTQNRSKANGEEVKRTPCWTGSYQGSKLTADLPQALGIPACTHSHKQHIKHTVDSIILKYLHYIL